MVEPRQTARQYRPQRAGKTEGMEKRKCSEHTVPGLYRKTVEIRKALDVSSDVFVREHHPARHPRRTGREEDRHHVVRIQTIKSKFAENYRDRQHRKRKRTHFIPRRDARLHIFQKDHVAFRIKIKFFQNLPARDQMADPHLFDAPVQHIGTHRVVQVHRHAGIHRQCSIREHGRHARGNEQTDIFLIRSKQTAKFTAKDQSRDKCLKSGQLRLKVCDHHLLRTFRLPKTDHCANRHLIKTRLFMNTRHQFQIDHKICSCEKLTLCGSAVSFNSSIFHLFNFPIFRLFPKRPFFSHHTIQEIGNFSIVSRQEKQTFTQILHSNAQKRNFTPENFTNDHQ